MLARQDLGVSLIVGYKLCKAAVQLLVAGVLLVLLAKGYAAHLHELASQLRLHSASAWSVALARLLLRATSAQGVELASAALAADAVLSFGEGYLLHRRLWWAPWLIVVATSTLLPLELWEIVRRPMLGRCILFLLNLSIVVYLARRARGESQGPRSAGPAR
jgi:uncharacterized membrane protein (DUF2068 family)